MSEKRQFNSRLGRVLVNKGLLSEAQLDFALQEQARSGQRLGEVLVAQGWINNQDLHRALKRQSLIRKAGALATVICAPLHATTGFAATLGGSPAMPTARAAVGEQQALPGGLVPMTDAEMGEALGQGPNTPFGFDFAKGYDGVTAGLRTKYDESDDEDDDNEERIAGELMDSVTTVAGIGPISSLIEADISMEGFRRPEGMPTLSILPDGAVRIYTGYEVDRINIENIRVKGSDDPATFGSIYISDVKVDPGSNYTIRSGNNRW